jgi:hypothetical protein
MHTELACLLCAVDPAAANLLLPVAQATIISAPILFRDQIRRGVGRWRDRGGPGAKDYPGASDAVTGIADGTVDPEATVVEEASSPDR